MSTCSRPGCDKKLRSNNTKGTCGSGCLSPDAPAFQRAKGVVAGEKRVKAEASARTASAPAPAGSFGKARQMAELLDIDFDALLEQFGAGLLAEWKKACLEAE